MIVVTCVALGGLLALVILTTVGAHRRDTRVLAAMLAGLFFPVTWTVWYLRDERPYASPHRSGAARGVPPSSPDE